MSGKVTIVGSPQHPETVMSNEAQTHYADGVGPSECLEVNTERDALRAEVAMLRAERDALRLKSCEHCGSGCWNDADALRARNVELVAALEQVVHACLRGDSDATKHGIASAALSKARGGQ